MTKIVFIICVVIGSLAVAFLSRSAKANLIERGLRLCPVCGGSELFQAARELARCDSCGHAVSLSALRDRS